MATQDEKRASDLGEQAIALAEQLGRIAGTIEGTAESWMNREKLTDQLARVRDGATQMLDGLTAGAERGRSAAASAVRKFGRWWAQKAQPGGRGRLRNLHRLLRLARRTRHGRPEKNAASPARPCMA